MIVVVVDKKLLLMSYSRDVLLQLRLSTSQELKERCAPESQMLLDQACDQRGLISFPGTNFPFFHETSTLIFALIFQGEQHLLVAIRDHFASVVIQGLDVLFIFSLPPCIASLLISNNTFDHRVLDFCSLISYSLFALLRLPYLFIHSKNLPDTSISVSLLLCSCVRSHHLHFSTISLHSRSLVQRVVRPPASSITILRYTNF